MGGGCDIAGMSTTAYFDVKCEINTERLDDFEVKDYIEHMCERR